MLSVNPLVWTSECLNENLYEAAYVYHGTWSYFIKPSHQPVCLSSLSLLGNGSIKTLPLQRMYAAIEEFVDLFLIRSVSYQRRETVRLYAYPLVVARQRLAKHVPPHSENIWRRQFICCLCMYVYMKISKLFVFPFFFFFLLSHTHRRVHIW
jgi:hypothetical protein